jgi:membrane-associated progesterone receptor component
VPEKTEDVQSVGGVGLAAEHHGDERICGGDVNKIDIAAVPACESVCDEIPMSSSYLIYAALPLAYLLLRFLSRSPSHPPPPPAVTTHTDDKSSLKTIMQAPRDDLHPPKSDPFTLSALAEFDGADATKPIYVSIKGNASRTYSCTRAPFSQRPRCTHGTGDVFDVTRKHDVYGKGGSYNIFAGKDGSKGLGMSSLEPKDAVPDYSTLPENEMKVLDDWHSFFSYVLPLASLGSVSLMHARTHARTHHRKRYNIVGHVTDMPEAVARKSSVL